MQGPYRFEISAVDVVFHDPDGVLGVVYQVFLAVEEITKHVYAEVEEPTPSNAAAFLTRLVDQSSRRIIAVTTDINPIFTDWRTSFNEDMAAVGPHPFAVACRTHRIVHNRSIPPNSKPPKIG
jgi:hypothetical protein